MECGSLTKGGAPLPSGEWGPAAPTPAIQAIPWDTCQGGWAIRTCVVTTLEEGIMPLEVGHEALGALEAPCTYVEDEHLS